MIDNTSSPDWPRSDKCWRRVTYLDYLNAMPRERFERGLGAFARNPPELLDRGNNQ